MKKTFLLPIAFLALVTALVQHPAKSETAGAPGTGQSQQAEDEGSAARMARGENDLPPAVVIKGQAVRATTLRERMQFYKVPGVSVAFFDHGKIIWTRAYGLADVAAQKLVTPETLFQAASISKPLSALAALILTRFALMSFPARSGGIRRGVTSSCRRSWATLRASYLYPESKGLLDSVQ